MENFTNAADEDAFKDALGASDDDYEKITAFLTYAASACSEAPTE